MLKTELSVIKVDVKSIYRFGGGQAEGNANMKDLLGGKGANLHEMCNLGLDVPPGFTITTEACLFYLANVGQWLPGLEEGVIEAMHWLEGTTGKKFGDASNPLLVSVRSGAKYSMPGMMDTILNLGMNEAVAKGLVKLTGNVRFVYDSYRRLIQMYGKVVLGIKDELFEQVLSEYRAKHGITNDAGLLAEDLKEITARFQTIIKLETGKDFPTDPYEQLKPAINAVFGSWNSKRAHDYRESEAIDHNLGTAVNIMSMVFGNMGEDSCTGVFTTRNVTTGENELQGDYLMNVQGEDVVSGTRRTKPIAGLAEENLSLYNQIKTTGKMLERHFREVQDVEFTSQQGKPWFLQTRNAKRTSEAQVRIQVEVANEGVISKQEAIKRVNTKDVDYFLHPQFDLTKKEAAAERGSLIATGLGVSPGAAVGELVFDADTAERLGKHEKRAVIMVRLETKPVDVHGMLASKGILTSLGGTSCHAALVARSFNIPTVVSAPIEIDLEGRCFSAAGRSFQEGELVSIDGATGQVFAGEIATVVPDFNNPHLLELLNWDDQESRLEVWANADYPNEAKRAREYGARGIGLCRTEHMFFEIERLPIVQKMILAKKPEDRVEPLARLLVWQRQDFVGLFRAMDGLPCTIRLIDPPLHEFLPKYHQLLEEVVTLRIKANNPELLIEKEEMLAAVESLQENNPMLGLRGVRLGNLDPDLTRMQVRAIFEAACQCAKEGIAVHPKIMIPLTAHVNELKLQRSLLEEEAQKVMQEQGNMVSYQFGTMIEIPRAALTAGEIAKEAAFFSFGTNDLTQTTYGISRDDAEKSFLVKYLERKILQENPFATIDEEGVGQLMVKAVQDGRATRPELEIGICGEHGGDPKSIVFCHKIGLDYVSCSTYRVPVARHAAAQAALMYSYGQLTKNQTTGRCVA